MTHDIKEELKEIIRDAYVSHSQTTSNLYGALKKDVEELKTWRRITMAVYGVGQSLIIVIISMAVWTFFSELAHMKENVALQIQGTNQRVEQLIEALEKATSKGQLSSFKMQPNETVRP